MEVKNPNLQNRLLGFDCICDLFNIQTQGHGFGSIGTGTWQHVALVRQSGSLYIYSNGVKYTVASDTTNYTGTTLVIGGYYSTSQLWNGYIDDFRITRGLARYTANFTPPTQAFSLL